VQTGSLYSQRGGGWKQSSDGFQGQIKKQAQNLVHKGEHQAAPTSSQMKLQGL